MELVVICSNFIKMFIITVLIYFIYIKIINYEYNNICNNIFVIICSINISIVYIILIQKILPMIVVVGLYTIYGLILNMILKSKEDYNIVAYIFSCILSYVIYLIAIIISGISLLALHVEKYTNPVSLLTIPIIDILLFYSVFRSKRFSKGFNFLKHKKINNKVKLFVLFLTGIIIVIFGISQKNIGWFTGVCLLMGSLFIVISIFFWIKSQITKTYKSKMRDRTIEIQKTEIDEKNKILEEVKEENLNFATTIHKYNKKISALEYIIKNRLEQETNTEFANELAIILKETKETAENFAKETEIKTNKIPETNVPGIDTMLKYMQEEARKKNINFDVKLNASINTLLENTISKDKFETLIGDHLKDAIIAVDTSKNTYKSILVTMGLVEGIYEFSVYDTGIEFEIETLLKLGEEQITTHKETGGSGIGFMTTFETLKECKASLIIEEYNPETTSYTKCITIRFDGKNKYKIYSYRANKIKEHKHKRKITIEELK